MRLQLLLLLLSSTSDMFLFLFLKRFRPLPRTSPVFSCFPCLGRCRPEDNPRRMMFTSRPFAWPNCRGDTKVTSKTVYWRCVVKQRRDHTILFTLDYWNGCEYSRFMTAWCPWILPWDPIRVRVSYVATAAVAHSWFSRRCGWVEPIEPARVLCGCVDCCWTAFFAQHTEKIRPQVLGTTFERCREFLQFWKVPWIFSFKNEELAKKSRCNLKVLRILHNTQNHKNVFPPPSSTLVGKHPRHQTKTEDSASR